MIQRLSNNRTISTSASDSRRASQRRERANGDLSDASLRGRNEDLLQKANDATALLHRLRLIEAQHRLAQHRSHYDPNQPRVPAGNPDGGQWTSGGGGGVGGVGPAAAQSASRRAAQVLNDAGPGGIRVWTQYAEVRNSDDVQGTNRIDGAAIAQTTATLHQVVLQVSAAVIRRPGSSPREYGVDVHTLFAKTVRALNLPGIGKDGVEQSFDAEGLARYGKDGSIRTDVVLRNEQDRIIAIYDLKTGAAVIRPPRAKEIRAMTQAGPDVPVIELHSIRGPANK
jgi:hypothetical protein